MYKLSGIIILTFYLTAQAYEIPITFDNDSPIKDYTSTTTDAGKPKINYRLPDDVIPIHYNISLRPYLEENSLKQFTFDGNITIELKIRKPTNEIVLHYNDIDFTKNIDVRNNGNPVAVNIPIKEPEKNFVKIQKQEGSFTTGTYFVTISYVGKLNDELRGFYRSSYINDKNQRVWLATTHFEPVDARRAFPCFDEPHFKATFEISITHEKKYTAVSNNFGTRKDNSDGTVTTTFQKTPKMSTYLIAFVVSDFEIIAHQNNKNFVVAARPNAIQHGSLALEEGLKILETLNNFTGVQKETNYWTDIGKMHQIAIPDFSAGAMENWGLVLYREKALLFDDKVSTTGEKQSIVEVIAHEFAHQWFGNLVSPKWWKYIWLNEGFATFFQSYIVEKVDPLWYSVEQSVVKSIQTTAFNFDSGSDTHPMNHDVESPTEIRGLFDSISYQKGGAVIRMMQHFLTEAVFQEGLQNYLKKMNHGVADSDDLFKSIQEIVDKKKLKLKVKDIMDTWVNYRGYPVVTVVRKNDSIEIKQERFLTYNASEEENKHKWQIPINYATEKNPDFKNTTAQLWLVEETSKIPSVKPNEWIILNKQQTGYYRVNYDEQSWDLIINYLNAGNFEKIHLLNRAQLINDALAFVQQEKLNIPTFIKLIYCLRNETNYIAWYPGFKAFSWLKEKLTHAEKYSVFLEFASTTMKSLIENVGLEANETDDYLKKLNRVTVADWACKLDDAQAKNGVCGSKMQEKLEAWLNSPENNTISPDLKEVTLCNGLRKANIDTWKKILEKITPNTKVEEKNQLIKVLGCSSNKDILEEYFNYAVKEKSPLENDTKAVVESIYQNSDIGVDTFLHFLIDRPIALLTKIDEKNIANMIYAVSKKITTPGQLGKLQKITDLPESTKIKAVEVAEKNIEWLKNNEKLITDSITEVLKKDGGNSAGIYTAPLILIMSSLLLTLTNQM